MTNKEYLFQLLYIAFLEIRMAAYERKNGICFGLADVLHNVPLQINTSDESEQGYANILQNIRERCEERKCTAWLDNAIANIENRRRDRDDVSFDR